MRGRTGQSPSLASAGRWVAAGKCSGLPRRLESGVRAVAEYRAGGVFAATEVDGLRFGGLKFDRGVVSYFVAAIAKRLVGAQSAGTPEVAFAGFDLDGIRAHLGNLGFGHGLIIAERAAMAR
jgi:hypothetical protein